MSTRRFDGSDDRVHGVKTLSHSSEFSPHTDFFFFSDFIFVLGAVRTPWILRSRYFVKWGICACARVTSARQKSGLCCVSSPLVPCGVGVPPSMGNLGQLAGTWAGLLEITSQLRLHGRKKKHSLPEPAQIVE